MLINFVLSFFIDIFATRETDRSSLPPKKRMAELKFLNNMTTLEFLRNAEQAAWNDFMNTVEINEEQNTVKFNKTEGQVKLRTSYKIWEDMGHHNEFMVWKALEALLEERKVTLYYLGKRIELDYERTDETDEKTDKVTFFIIIKWYLEDK